MRNSSHKRILNQHRYYSNIVRFIVFDYKVKKTEDPKTILNHCPSLNKYNPTVINNSLVVEFFEDELENEIERINMKMFSLDDLDCGKAIVVNRKQENEYNICGDLVIV